MDARHEVISYSADRLDLAAIEPDLVRLWRDNLDLHGDPRRKFEWTFREAPSPPLGALLLRSEGAAVGCVGVMLRSFEVSGARIPAALIGDLAVDARHRSVLPAVTLVRAAHRLALERGALTYGFPNAAAVGVLKRCGYVGLGTFTRYARVLHHKRFVGRRISSPAIASVAGPVLDTAKMMGLAPAGLRTLMAHRLDKLDDFDARFDALWERARGSYDIVGERKAAFLKWRFTRHPEARGRIFALVDRKAPNHVCAYAVVDRDQDAVRIRDWFGEPDSLGPLLDLLLPSLVVSGRATSVSMRYLGRPDVVALLSQRGFEPREARWPIVFDATPGPRISRDALRDPARWHLTDADEDV